MTQSYILKFAIIGCGYIGKRHAAVIAVNPETETVATCDVLAVAPSDITPDLPYFSDPQSMLDAHKEIDVVSICTPNGMHAHHAVLALECGKHVLIEKPMALSVRESEQILHAALLRGKQVFCVMQNRYSPPSVWLKERIAENKLGSIYMVQINCFWNRSDAYYSQSVWKGRKNMDGGTLFTQFSHFVDILYWLFGDISNISARVNNNSHKHNTEFEDCGMVTFDLVNGGMGQIAFTTSAYNSNFESSLTVIAERGTVRIGGQYMNELQWANIEDCPMPNLPVSASPNDYGTHLGSAANHEPVIQNVVDTLKGRKRIGTNALEGHKVVDMIERIYHAAK